MRMVSGICIRVDFSMGVCGHRMPAPRAGWLGISDHVLSTSHLEPHRVDLTARTTGQYGDGLDRVACGKSAAPRFLQVTLHVCVRDRGLVRGRAFYDDSELAAWLLKVRKGFCSGAPEDLLESLRELPADGDAALAEYFAHIVKCPPQPMRRLEQDE